MANSSEPLFQIPGISSGLDWGDMIDTIMEKARVPITIWEAQQDTLRLKVGLYEEFSSVLKTARNTLTVLKQPSTFKMKQAEVVSHTSGVSESAILTATATTDAYLGKWDIEVLQKAVAENRVSNRFNSASEALGLEGSFFIRTGSQRVEIGVKSSESLREINLKISQALDDHGNSLNIDSKLIDNRLVLSSSFSGLGSSTGTSATVTRGSWTTGSGGKDFLPLPDDGVTYPLITEVKSGSTTYTEGIDYSYDQGTGTISWLSGGAHPATDEEYTITFDGEYTWNTNTFSLEAGTGADIIAALGLDLNDAEHYAAAQDAELLVEGVHIVRSSNTIDDLIGGVTLDIQGPGKVTMNILADTEEAVTSIEEFVTAYNEVMDWINIRLSEESEVDTLAKDDPKRSDDFYKKFGLLHGDSLLWQTKSQLRRLTADPVNILGPLKQFSQIGITTEDTDHGKSGKLVFDKDVFMKAMTPNSLPFMDQWMTDALRDSTTPLNELKTGFTGGNFYINAGGKRTRVSVEASDTLSDINSKINIAKDIASGNRIGVRSTIIGNALSISSTDIDEAIRFEDPDGVLKKLGIDVSDPFDSIHHVQDTSAYVGNLLTTAMSNLDTYFGNLVDSSQVAVGSSVSIKGRVASQISHLNTQITDIDKRIANFETQLATKQRGLYSQYSKMEITLAKLNQQYSWLASTISSLTAQQGANAS